MKNSTMEALHAYANTDPNFPSDLRDEINTEYDKSAAKKQANIDLYATAHDVLMSTENWVGKMTAKEIAAACEAELPDGFSASKIQYAFRAKWSDEVEKHENGKNALTYSRKKAIS